MRLLRFLIAGGSAAAVEYGIFLLLRHYFGPEILIIAQTVSFLVGFVVSFNLNRLWVFKSNGKLSAELSKYLILLGVNLVATNLTIGLLVNELMVTDWIAKMIVMGLVAAWNYLIFQKIIFKSKKQN